MREREREREKRGVANLVGANAGLSGLCEHGREKG
jgi:hypothetical protein